ncbi:kinesin-like protein, putative, partial [Bodo saltans]
MAYGQTGSGKTYSMFGPHADELADVQRQRAITSTSPLPPRHVPGVSAKSSLVRRLQYDEDRGIIFRLLEECFTEMKQHKDVERRASLSALRSPAHAQDAAAAMVNFDVEITYYQVYREKVYCLLTGSHQSSFAFDANCQSGSAVKSLRVRESAKNGPYVEGLKSTNVRTLEDAVALLDLGNKNRRVAATSQNIHSSRSHAVLSLRLRCIRSSEDASFTSVMNLVDLAGSERAGKLSEPSLAYASTFSMPRGTGNAARLSETSDINRSLSTLGKVIHVLAAKANGGSNVSPPMSAVSTARGTSARSHQQQTSINTSAMSQQQQQHVPYRESTLTFLLRDSLGGNSSTTILSTISPMLDDVAETLSTLRYASKARHIINTPVVNTDAKSAMLVSALRDEVQHLRQQLQVSLSATHQRELEETMTAKQRQLDEYESEMANMSQERSQWEVEKVTMMERVVVLEHEAESLRDELTAAMETADEYRAKLEQLTLMV